MSDRLQPQNIEAEQAVLGAMLNSKEAVPKAFQWLKDKHFYKDAHAVIYRAMEELFSKGEPIDTITTCHQLKQSKQLDKVGGAYYVSGLVGASPTTANVESHAKQVFKKWHLRELILLSHNLASDAYDDTKDSDDIIDTAEQSIFNIAQSRVKGGFTATKDIVHDAMDVFDERSRNGGIAGIATGLRVLDNITAGFHKGELTVIAGRPSQGKTSLALTIARNMAVKGRTVGFFSLEMTKVELVSRLLIAEARIDGQEMRTGKLKPEGWSKLMATAHIIAEAPIFFDETPVMNITQIRAKARRLKSEHNAEVIFVDYIGLMNDTGKELRRDLQVGIITRGLKALAKELNVIVVAISQLSRRVEERKPQIPVLSDLRDSGSIEQDADVVIFLYRKYFYSNNYEDKGKALLIIAKQRNGETGRRELVFIENYAKFEDKIDIEKYSL